MPPLGVVSHQSGEPFVSESAEMPSTVQRMESGDRQIWCVADVMKVRRGHQDISILWYHPDRQLARRIGNRLRMAPPTSEWTQQLS